MSEKITPYKDSALGKRTSCTNVWHHFWKLWQSKSFLLVLISNGVKYCIWLRNQIKDNSWYCNRTGDLAILMAQKSRKNYWFRYLLVMLEVGVKKLLQKPFYHHRNDFGRFWKHAFWDNYFDAITVALVYVILRL
jgi:hypothetical protein